MINRTNSRNPVPTGRLNTSLGLPCGLFGYMQYILCQDCSAVQCGCHERRRAVDIAEVICIRGILSSASAITSPGFFDGHFHSFLLNVISPVRRMAK